ncbi:PLP-dependent aminotransferase family protein [Vibrio intestinalis]|uniref:aminotransferase-like domain-containing protein n=1 Tax=Vibrio intestinalis TaxID=2933291 RepID=UPI003D816A06
MNSINKYLSVEQHLKQAIDLGVYAVDDKLPSIRQLSGELEVSKNTVIRAYQELEALGTIYSVPKSGYRVKAPLSQPSAKQAPSEVDMLAICKEILSPINHKAYLPAGSAHPRTDAPAIRSLYAEIGRHSRLQSQIPSNYQLPPGHDKLIQQIVRICHEMKVSAHADDIAITHGAQQAISLALRAITQPGDIVAVESPCYFGNLLLMESLGLKVVEVASCVNNGLNPEALAEAIEQWPIAAVLLTPNFCNPTGSRIPLKQRERILDVSRDIPIIEDDVFGELAYDQGIPSLYQLDDKQRVIYVNSFSKTLDSRLRVGWVISGRYRAAIEKQLLCDNMGSLNLMQSALSSFLASGKYRSHINKMRRVYQQNSKQMIKLLKQALNEYPSLKEHYHLTQPEGAFLIWFTSPKLKDSYQLYLECKRDNISLLPGKVFATSDQFNHGLRLSSANFDDTPKWRQGITALAAKIAAHCSD